MEFEPSLEDISQSPSKLFVGQIPKEVTEPTLSTYFEEFGPLREVCIIRDQATGISKGCAFVTFYDHEAACVAVENLHDKLKLPNATNPLQVRFAETPNERDNKLFVGMLPKTFTENELFNMFASFGELKEVHIIRGPEGSPKGCAFVKFVTKDAAVNAINVLNDSIPDGGTRPLVVKFADIKKPGFKSESTESTPDYPQIKPTSLNKQESWYNVPQQAPTQNAPQIRPTQYVVESNQMQQPQRAMYPYAMTNQMSQPMYEYNTMPGMTAAYPQAAFPNPTFIPNTYETPLAPSNAPSSVPSTQQSNQQQYTRPPEGPSGSNLFIYHLPRDLTDADLATLFAPFGNVISAKVFVDKRTSDSKGFGFVSYDRFESANAAIESMNGFQIGSKRLKVQHKRVNGSPMMSGQVLQMPQLEEMRPKPMLAPQMMNLPPQGMARLPNDPFFGRKPIPQGYPMEPQPYPSPTFPPSAAFNSPYGRLNPNTHMFPPNNFPR